MENFASALNVLIDDMFETMYGAEGVGLAANQIGILQQVAVIDVSPERNQRLELVNPRITAGAGRISCDEGCLSVPDYREVVTRSKTIKVTAQNRHGEHFELDADDLLSRCIQHELDHLNGLLFVDKLSALKRQLFKRWFRKHGAADDKLPS